MADVEDLIRLTSGLANGVARLREVVLGAAVRGRLVDPIASEGDGHSQLRRLMSLPAGHRKTGGAANDTAPVLAMQAIVPDHWAVTTVESTVSGTGVFCDGDWVESKDQDPNGDVRLIQLADVGDGEYRDRSSRFMTKAAAARLKCSYLAPGDLLIARMPDPLGRSCRFPGDSKPAVTVVDVCILRPDVRFFDPDFLVIAINCPYFRGLVRAQATGTTRSRISRSNLGVLPIPLPPLAEQKRIVARVDELMALCDRLEAQLQERDARSADLAKAALARFSEAPTVENLEYLFHESFTVGSQGLRDATLTLALQGRFSPQQPSSESRPTLSGQRAAQISSYYGVSWVNALPASWRWFELSEVADRIQYGYTASADSGLSAVRMLRITDIQNNKVNWSKVPGCEITSDELRRFQLSSNDILIARTGGTVGKSYLIQAEPPAAVFASYLIRIVAGPSINASYLKLFLESPQYWKQLRLMSAGTGQPNVNGRALGGLLLPVPPLAEQKRIVAKIEELMGLVDQLEAQLAASEEVGTKLLDALVAELAPSN